MRMQEVDTMLTNLIETTKVSGEEASRYLMGIGEDPVRENITLNAIVKRPTVQVHDLLVEVGAVSPTLLEEHADSVHRVQTAYRYAGYIEKQKREVERFEEYERKAIPPGFDYSRVQSLSTEAREKLSKIQPSSIGQASRIPGVSASDVSILAVYLR